MLNKKVLLVAAVAGVVYLALRPAKAQAAGAQWMVADSKGKSHFLTLGSDGIYRDERGAAWT